MVTPIPKPAGLAEVAYQHLKQSILEATLLPGATIYGPKLAKEFDISRTPVREAMIRLHQEGWLLSGRGTGYVVKPLSIKEVEDIYEMRLLLEHRAILNYARHISAGRIEKLQAELERAEARLLKGDVGPFLKVHQALHENFIDFCENEILKWALNNLRERMYRIRKFTGTEKNRHVAGALEEQRAITDALIAGDPQAAGQALITHLETSRERVLAQLADVEHRTAKEAEQP